MFQNFTDSIDEMDKAEKALGTASTEQKKNAINDWYLKLAAAIRAFLRIIDAHADNYSQKGAVEGARKALQDDIDKLVNDWNNAANQPPSNTAPQAPVPPTTPADQQPQPAGSDPSDLASKLGQGFLNQLENGARQRYGAGGALRELADSVLGRRFLDNILGNSDNQDFFNGKTTPERKFELPDPNGNQLRQIPSDAEERDLYEKFLKNGIHLVPSEFTKAAC